MPEIATVAFSALKAEYRNFAMNLLSFRQHWQPRADCERNDALRIGELGAATK